MPVSSATHSTICWCAIRNASSSGRAEPVVIRKSSLSSRGQGVG